MKWIVENGLKYKIIPTHISQISIGDTIKCRDGVIDFKKEDNTWGLPKDIMQALAKEIAWQYKHPNPPYGYKKRIERFYNNM